MLGAVAGAGSLLMACGTGATTPPASATRPRGPISLPADSSSSAKQGGTLRSVAVFDVPSFDPHSAQSSIVHTQVAAYTYPRLLKFATAKFPDRPRGDVEGDLAESFELSADKLQLTIRLRQGLKWENKAPVNGRTIDASDVMASWNRFLRLSPFKTDLAYDANVSPGAPIDTLTSPDARTVVVKLKQPDSSILSLFSSDRHFYVLPKEADAGFDPRFEPRGYGPYRMTENRAMAFRAWSRNPDYHVKGRPFIDTIELPIISDYASRLGQFKAGNVWTHVAAAGDLLTVKREIPSLELMNGDSFSTTPSSLSFGYEGDSPWKDERLRQAVSMLLDRETMIDVHANRSHYLAEGVDYPVRYHTAIGAGWEGYWIDPRSEQIFGPNARFFTFDRAEAKRLMAAAGFADGLDSSFHYNGGGQYGVVYARTAELVSGMLAAGDIRLRLEPHEYPDWQQNYQFAYTAAQNAGKQIKGFNGLAYRVAAQYPSAVSQMFAQMHKDGARFEGMTPDGKNAHLGDADANATLAILRREFDLKKQQEMAQDFARTMAKKAYLIPNLPFSPLGFTLTWLAIGNLGVYRGWPVGNAITEGNLNLWIDASQPPLSPS